MKTSTQGLQFGSRYGILKFQQIDSQPIRSAAHVFFFQIGENMSSRLFIDDILFYQRLLSVAGIYSGRRDGRWSAAVDAADQAFVAEFDRIAAQLGTFDPGRKTTSEPSFL